MITNWSHTLHNPAHMQMQVLLSSCLQDERNH